MADGCHLGKIEKKSPYLGHGLTDFDRIWHGDTVRPLQPSNHKKFQILKIQGGGSCHLQKSKNRHISAAV